MWFATEIALKPKSRGVHLVTSEITRMVPEIQNYKVGMMHLLLQHTSAGLSINENADPDVRIDMSEFIERLVPDGLSYFQHTLEGADDMPAHIKSSLFGVELTLPIHKGCLALGTWQGIYLGEFRNAGGARRIHVTLYGEMYD